MNAAGVPRDPEPPASPPPAGPVVLPIAPRVIGRDAEIARLDAFIHRIQGKDAGLFVVSGEAGVGKTRLVNEAGTIAAAQSVGVLAVACQDRDRGVAYAPWVELIRRYVENTPREEVYRSAGPHLSALIRLAPELADRVWLYDPAAAPVEWERRPFLAAVSRFFVSIAQGHPLLIAIDDLGWADAASLELLETLVRVSEGSALGVVGAYRDTHLDENPALQQLLLGLERQRSCETVVLPPLDQDRLGELIGAVLGRSSVPRELRDLVYTKTRGNPFYTREVLQSLADEGSIYRTPDGWTWTSAAAIRLPPTVGRTIAGRLARLDEESLRVLRVASLLGLEFPFDLLRRVAEVGEEPLLASLESAVRAKLLREVAAADRRSFYQFSHPLIQEVLEGEVSRARAEGVHLRAARVLEEMYGAGAKEHAASLAYHYLRGNDHARALEYSAEAGDRAAAVFARGEAVGHYRAALELLRPTDDPRLRCRMKEALADQLRGLSEITAAATLFEEAGREWEAAGDRISAGSCLRKAAECFQGSMAHERELRAQALRLLEEEPPGGALVLVYLSNGLRTYDEGRVDEARVEYRRALTLAEGLGDVESQAWALLRLAFCAPSAGKFEYADCTQRAAKLVEGHGLSGPVVGQLQLNRAAFAYHCLGEVGGPSGVVAGLEGLLKAARANNDLERESWVVGFALPWVYLRAGDLRAAWAGIEERRRRFQFVGLAGWAPNSESVGVRAWVGTLLGPLDRAEALLAEAERIGRERPNWFIDAVTFQFLGRLFLARGEPEAAIPHLDRSLEEHRRAGFPAWHLQWSCETLELLTRAELAAGRRDRARQKAKQAREFAEAIGSEAARAFAGRAHARCVAGRSPGVDPLEELEGCRAVWDRLGWKYDAGVTWFAMGELLASRGESERATGAFRKALASFGEVGAQPDVDRTRRQLEAYPA